MGHPVQDVQNQGHLVGIEQDGEYGVGPVAAVGEEAQVGERLLGTARLPLELGQLVAELDQELIGTDYYFNFRNFQGTCIKACTHGFANRK